VRYLDHLVFNVVPIFDAYAAIIRGIKVMKMLCLAYLLANRAYQIIK